jgi:hypothetical protein
MSALGQKQTCAVQKAMSALLLKADIGHPKRVATDASHWKFAGPATMGLTGPSFGFSALQMM